MPAPLLAAAVIFAALAALWLVLALVAVRHRRWGRMSGGVVLGLLFLALAALCATVSVSVQGYRALTHEVVNLALFQPQVVGDLLRSHQLSGGHGLCPVIPLDGYARAPYSGARTRRKLPLGGHSVEMM